MSNDVKRYDILGHDGFSAITLEHEQGDWVTASDYDALRAENERLTAELEALKAQQAEQKPAARVVMPERKESGDTKTTSILYFDIGFNAALDEVARLNATPAYPDTGALVEALEKLKLSGAYLEIEGTDCFNNGVTACQEKLRALKAHKVGGAS